jgi:hypothetical protein
VYHNSQLFAKLAHGLRLIIETTKKMTVSTFETNSTIFGINTPCHWARGLLIDNREVGAGERLANPVRSGRKQP